MHTTYHIMMHKPQHPHAVTSQHSNNHYSIQTIQQNGSGQQSDPKIALLHDNILRYTCVQKISSTQQKYQYYKKYTYIISVS